MDHRATLVGSEQIKQMSNAHHRMALKKKVAVDQARRLEAIRHATRKAKYGEASLEKGRQTELAEQCCGHQ